MFSSVRISVIGFLFGIAFELLFHAGIFFSTFLILFSALIYPVSRRFSKGFFVFLAILFFAAGTLRTAYVTQREDSALKNFEGIKTTFTGIISQEPDVRENSTRLIVTTSDGKILIIAKKYPAFEYGEKISVTGKLETPKNFTSDTGREFDYISYLAKDEIFYEMAFPKIEVIAHGEGNAITSSLLFVKRAFMERVSQILPEPSSSLMGGLLLGMKRSLGSDLQNDFRTVGIIHIVVLSGYNITVVADFISQFFSFLPKIFGAFASVIAIFFFAVMTGSGASTFRASIMAALVIFAKIFGREGDALHLLFIAAFVMVFQNPMILLYDPSFQLSFLATLGLFVLSPKISERLTRVTKKFGIRETLAATLSTQIFVLPLLLYQTGIFSFVSVPVNLLVLAVIPATMLLGFLAGIFCFISYPIAMIFGAPAFALTSYIFGVVELFARLPFAATKLPAFSVWGVVIVYIFYAIIFLSRRRLPHCS